MAYSTLSLGFSSRIASKNKDKGNSSLWKYVTRIKKIGERRGS